ncbi:MAG: hypothetical protein E6491_00860 [Streptococcus anginosus]|uniref:hypothetical protein n=1 Tax=Streptococcus anginosus TaxID=1328 RepID=UPI0003549CC5|nr:hypothetical protein [Streptococcus anginosus]MDU6599549.1 hypothetical protein [Streptococcus anginosus]BAN61409.1 hypothetical protein ANG_0939 [Streptococcus anginosus subsp. whileyi MAS624]
MKSRLSIYCNEKNLQKFEEVVAYLGREENKFLSHKQTVSSTFTILLETFYQLFIETGNEMSYFERMARLKQDVETSPDESQRAIKQLKKQMDQLLYLELTNFHSITKGEEWDVQDLESVYSKLDSKQHELLARIQDVIQEDIARGQTVKHSH